MLNFILTAIPTYWMLIFKLPCWVLSSIERIHKDFLWSRSDHQHRKVRLVNWNRICRSREQGGWNILNVENFNIALLGKWWWKFSVGGRWCGEAIFRENYFRRSPSWNLYQQQGSRRSFLWRGFLHALPAFRTKF